MNSPVLLNVPRSEKSASIRKRRKDELEKYRRECKEIDAVLLEQEFLLPDEDRFLADIKNLYCARPDRNAPHGSGFCYGPISLLRRMVMRHGPKAEYSVGCRKCKWMLIQWQPSSQQAMRLFSVHRAMCK